MEYIHFNIEESATNTAREANAGKVPNMSVIERFDFYHNWYEFLRFTFILKKHYEAHT